MSSRDELKALLISLPDELGMHLICEPVVLEVGANCIKDPGGLAGFVMIAESHISFHTFPERGFVTIDLYTCRNDVDRNWVCSRLISAFDISDADIYIQERGKRYRSANLVMRA